MAKAVLNNSVLAESDDTELSRAVVWRRRSVDCFYYGGLYYGGRQIGLGGFG